MFLNAASGGLAGTRLGGPQGDPSTTADSDLDQIPELSATQMLHHTSSTLSDVNILKRMKILIPFPTVFSG